MTGYVFGVPALFAKKAQSSNLGEDVYTSVVHSYTYDKDYTITISKKYLNENDKVLIVDDEMDGRTYETDKTFKTVLSTKTLTTRRKYDRRISNIKRRCSFAGSGNNLNIVREQQNRRIVPIEVADIDKENLAFVDLTDLFMEAYNLYKSGFQYSYVYDDSLKLKKNIFC